MLRFSVAIAFASVVASTPVPLGAQELPPPTVRAIHVTGDKEIPPRTIEDLLPIRVGEPFTDTPEHIAEAVTQHYQKEGYTFARVKAAFATESGNLAIDIDE